LRVVSANLLGMTLFPLSDARIASLFASATKRGFFFNA
jgi:hypothetical protein